MIVVGVLIFYAAGIASDLFANHILSMFFIISYDTAHNIVAYEAIGAAIAINIVVLSSVIIEERKKSLTEKNDNPNNGISDILDEKFNVEPLHGSQS